MAILTVQMQCDDASECVGDQATGWDHQATGLAYDGEATVRIGNEAAENGHDQDPGPLDWLNSARITTDPDDDAVRCLVSVGDPRGAFEFTVRRLPDGRIVIHVPYPGEPLPHFGTAQLHPGTLQVAGNFASEADEDDE